MPAPNQLLSIGQLQDLFYRAKYSYLLGALAREQEIQGRLDTERLLIKANALFEMHKVAEANTTLRSVSQEKDTFDENYLYALARVTYLDNKLEDARAIFQDIVANTKSPRHRFKGLLGIANTYFPLFADEKVPGILKELTGFEPLERLDERISLTIFLGNYHLARSELPLAREYFKKGLSLAASQTWTYFITRCLMGLATVHEKDGKHSEMMWTLDMLQAFIDESEQHFQSFVVNSLFGNYFSINTPMEFDPSNKRIMIKNSWLPFHDRPLLFEFLLLLHDKGAFVDKQAIAEHLWPAEGYKARVHDPRIFDIAKRARTMIETYENQPVVLLSGRMGYKLASI